MNLRKKKLKRLTLFFKIPFLKSYNEHNKKFNEAGKRSGSPRGAAEVASAAQNVPSAGAEVARGGESRGEKSEPACPIQTSKKELHDDRVSAD